MSDTQENPQKNALEAELDMALKVTLPPFCPNRRSV